MRALSLHGKRWLGLIGIAFSVTSCDVFTSKSECEKFDCTRQDPTADASASASPSESGTSTASASASSSSALSSSLSSDASTPQTPAQSGSLNAPDGAAPGVTEPVASTGDTGSGADGGPAPAKMCPECPLDRPVCDISSASCVMCLTATNVQSGLVDIGCGDAKPRCITQALAQSPTSCVECGSDADCSHNTSKPVCDTKKHSCVGCETHDDCLDPKAPRCETVTQTCSPCTPLDDVSDGALAGTNHACSHFAGQNVCSTGQCVECSASDSPACGNTSFCDLDKDSSHFETCRRDLTLHSAQVCDTCVNNAQCKAGMGCVMTQFGSADAGYFCLWRQDTALMNADPATVKQNRDLQGIYSCTRDALPYGREVTVSSLGSDNSGLFCAPKAATCPAIQQFSTAKCQAPAVPSTSTSSSATSTSNPGASTSASASASAAPSASASSSPSSSAAPPELPLCGALLHDTAGMSSHVDDALCQKTDSTGLEWRCSPRCGTDEDCLLLDGLQFSCLKAAGAAYKTCAFN